MFVLNMDVCSWIIFNAINGADIVKFLKLRLEINKKAIGDQFDFR